jgi:hypothetical protein
VVDSENGKMNALVLAFAHWFGFLGKCQVTMHSYGFLCAELD